jgi:hypothetical protein
VLTDTTPARGVVADSQLKDQRILFPDPSSAATKTADLFVFVFGSRAPRPTRPVTRSRCPAPRGWRSKGVPGLPVHKLPPGLPFDHLDLCWRCQSGGCRFCLKGIADVTRAHHRLH